MNHDTMFEPTPPLFASANVEPASEEDVAERVSPRRRECSICGGTGEIMGLPFDGVERTMGCPECIETERRSEIRVLRAAYDILIDSTVSRSAPEIREDVDRDMRIDAAKALGSAAKAEIGGLLRD
jgi:hypothetical protein